MFLVFFFFLPGSSGSAMNVVYGEEEMKRFLEEAAQVSQVSPKAFHCQCKGYFTNRTDMRQDASTWTQRNLY